MEVNKLSKRVPINDEISNHLISAFTEMQEAYRIAVTEFSLYELKDKLDVDIMERLAADAELLFERYLRLRMDTKIYMRGREVTLDES